MIFHDFDDCNVIVRKARKLYVSSFGANLPIELVLTSGQNA